MYKYFPISKQTNINISYFVRNTFFPISFQHIQIGKCSMFAIAKILSNDSRSYTYFLCIQSTETTHMCLMHVLSLYVSVQEMAPFENPMKPYCLSLYLSVNYLCLCAYRFRHIYLPPIQCVNSHEEYLSTHLHILEYMQQQIGRK